MKSLNMILAICCAALAHSEAIIEDPVAAYLKGIKGMAVGRSTGQFYSDDCIYKYEVDLNNDGINEVLVSSSLEQDGKQGFVFSVYKQVAGGFQKVGKMYLSPEGFYLGKIDEINAFGVVNFWPTGGGTGGYGAYIFDGIEIKQQTLGTRLRNSKTGELEGATFDKYFGGNAKKTLSALTTIGSDELETKYSVHIDPRTYVEAITNSMADQAKSPTPAPVIKPSAPPAVEGPVKPLPITSPVVKPPQQSVLSEPESKLRLLSLLAVISAVVGLIVILLRKKGK